MEDSKSSANTCRAKVAELSSAALDPPDLLKASQIYQRLGLACLDSNLLKFNAKGYFLQAILCQLANGDAVGAEQALSRYEGVDYTFTESREGKFARQLVDCVDRLDAESMATACFEFDRISKLDPWKTSMLVKVKRSIQEDGGTGGGGGGGDDEDDVDLT
jgi:alpha-soluble NSF attachment protein